MSEYIREREIQRKREYHKKWRAEHPENVKAAQVRYWSKVAAEMRTADGQDNADGCEREE